MAEHSPRILASEEKASATTDKTFDSSLTSTFRLFFSPQTNISSIPTLSLLHTSSSLITSCTFSTKITIVTVAVIEVFFFFFFFSSSSFSYALPPSPK